MPLLPDSDDSLQRRPIFLSSDDDVVDDSILSQRREIYLYMKVGSTFLFSPHTVIQVGCMPFAPPSTPPLPHPPPFNLTPSSFVACPLPLSHLPTPHSTQLHRVPLSHSPTFAHGCSPYSGLLCSSSITLFPPHPIQLCCMSSSGRRTKVHRPKAHRIRSRWTKARRIKAHLAKLTGLDLAGQKLAG